VLGPNIGRYCASSWLDYRENVHLYIPNHFSALSPAPIDRFSRLNRQNLAVSHSKGDWRSTTPGAIPPLHPTIEMEINLSAGDYNQFRD
jgi:hypothetical protein